MMSKKIDYSIIIPTHNSSECVNELLRSLPQIGSVQVIIVDDHSTDTELKKTKAIFDGYSFGNKQLLVNRGINSAGAARNIGLDRATGKWLVFADSDDYFTADIKDILSKYEKSHADIVFFRVGGNGVTARADVLNALVGSRDANRIRYKHVVPWGKIISRQLVERESLRFSEVLVSNDELFSAKVGFFAKDIIFDDTTGYYSVERQNSLTTQAHSTTLQDIRLGEALKKYKFLRDNLGSSGLRRTGLSIFPVIKKAVSVGGIMYGMRWYGKIWRVGGRLNLATVLKARFLR